jgi:hypothetical protein
MKELGFTPEQELSVWSWSDVSSINPPSSSRSSRAFGDRTGRYKLFIGQFKWALVDVKVDKILGQGSFEAAQFKSKKATANGTNVSFEVDGGNIGIYKPGGGFFTFSEGQETLARQMNLAGRVDHEISEGEFVISGQEIAMIESIYLGGAGVPLKTYEKSTLIVSPKGFSIGQGGSFGSSIWTKSFEGLNGIQITGEGLYQTGGGWIGGGFGISGALQGAAFASVMNALTTRTHNDCYFRFVYPGTDATFQVLSHAPKNLEAALSGVRNWLETRNPVSAQSSQGGSSTSRVEQLEKLHQLFEKGILTKSEYQAEKKRILASD